MVNVEQFLYVSSNELSPLMVNHAVTIEHAGTIGISCSAQPSIAGHGFSIITLEGRNCANNDVTDVDNKLSYQ